MLNEASFLDYCIEPGCSVHDAIGKMHEYGTPAVAVCKKGLMVGLFTNGDMRRFFLGGGNVQEPISSAMNKTPACFSSYDDIVEAKRNRPLVVYPLVDADGTLKDLVFDETKTRLRSTELREVPLVVMAGGKGTRLYPYTRILPKALIPLGGKTISERIIETFYDCGCREFFFIVNHKAEMIEAYFNELKTDYKVVFLKEEKFLGTGGGLGLLRGMIRTDFFFSNCDILINDDLLCAYRTHVEKGNAVTFVCAAAKYSVPYGVVESDDSGELINVDEKPSFTFLVNTGVYIVSPLVFDYIGEDEFIHFPDIAMKMREDGMKLGVFPVPEKSWIDIGEVGKMDAALKMFGDSSGE